MDEQKRFSRRAMVKSSVFGFVAVSVPNISFSKNILPYDETENAELHSRYPKLHSDIVSEVVGVSHFDLDRLKKLVDPRPELSRSTWDWAFGDFESAIDAASHVARKDIVEYLIERGARPTIFTFAMLGSYKTVRSMIEFHPGIQKTTGPHGISLLQHAKYGLMNKTGDEEKAKKLIDYLEGLGDADGPEYLEIKEAEKQKYLGDYKYGEGEKDGFSIKLNMRKMLALGKIGEFGGGLYKITENEFIYNGVPSVKITFDVEDEEVLSLTIHEPDLTLKANKV